ncbi:hypothetical protein AGR8A_pAt20206 [Agrobacterium fabrum str. J-07]|nr:hypothetical protein AGR8A_pAt20206 [Agrobacterium fabrum str. J-07]
MEAGGLFGKLDSETNIELELNLSAVARAPGIIRDLSPPQ